MNRDNHICDSCGQPTERLWLVGSTDTGSVYAICEACFALERPEGFWTVSEPEGAR